MAGSNALRSRPVANSLVKTFGATVCHGRRYLAFITDGRGSIANYYPDFIVKRTETEIWIIETKDWEDLDDPQKWERLKQWCGDATKIPCAVRATGRPGAHKLTGFGQLVTACG